MLDTTDTALRDEEARNVLRGDDMGTYTVPTHGLYPYQWNWDSAFSAWGMATFDTDRAWTEVETLLAHQWPSGMVPHIIFHKDDPGYFPGPDVWASGREVATSGISQPPVAASFVRRLLEQDPDGRDRAAALVEPLLKWHGWFMQWRMAEGCIFVTHPWESGRDNARDWDVAMGRIDTSGVGEYQRRDTSHVDAAMRPHKADYDRYLALLYHGRDTGWSDAEIAATAPFRVADPGMTFILLRACRDLVWLADATGQSAGDTADWIAELEAGAARHWNSELGAYDSWDLQTGDFTGTISSASYLCWYAGVEQPRMMARLTALFDRVKYPVPSLDPDNPDLDPLRYWRGPTWPIINTLIGLGLEDMGHTDAADRLRRGTAELVAGHGFNEYFEPSTGTAAGGRAFSWTAAVWLAWLSPTAKGGG